MAIVTIKANDTKLNKEASINFDMPASLKEMSDKWGESATYDLAKRQATIQIQAQMRTAMKTNNDVNVAAAYKPGVTNARMVDPLAAAKAALSAMSAEERTKWLREIGIK
jgi:hypothetical protein